MMSRESANSSFHHPASNTFQIKINKIFYHPIQFSPLLETPCITLALRHNASRGTLSFGRIYTP